MAEPAPSTPGGLAWAGPGLVAAGLDAFALWALVSWRSQPLVLAIVATSHVLAVVVAGFPAGAPGSQRAFMAAFTFALPLIGTGVAVLAIKTRGRGTIVQNVDVDPGTGELQLPTMADIHRLTHALPACEALLSGTPDERSATVAMLARYPDAAAIALLRRAVARGESDVAVEAALTLEDLGARLDAHATAARRALEDAPDFERAVSDANTLADAIHSGLPEASSLPTLIEVARRGYETAVALRPESLPKLAWRWIRLELDALAPQAALAVLDRAAEMAPNPRFEGLRARLLPKVARETRARHPQAKVSS